MKEEILNKLNEIEQKHQVEILYACESGSRAWGFESPDSDYDVRFIYSHPQDWYLQVDYEKKRDVIEVPINKVLDISGWDLKKSLQLLMKSNPVLLEWLNSPIVYKKREGFQEEYQVLTGGFSKKTCFYHYLHMAKRNNREYLRGEQVRLKKYFYVLRPILAMHWLERDLGQVPMEFDTLVNEILPNGELRDDIEQLVAKKKVSLESKFGPAIPSINKYINEQIPILQEKVESLSKSSLDMPAMNAFFKKYMKA